MQQSNEAQAPEQIVPERSNYTDTAVINEMAGNGTNGGWEAIDHQLGIIESEFKEMRDGIQARDIHELRDGIQDLLFTTYGMAWRAGFDADEDYAEVVRSNLTKFDTSEEDALKTRDKYLLIGVETVIRKLTDLGTGKVFYITKSAKDQTGTDSKSYPGGKWLKSYRFEEPRYSPLQPEVAAKLQMAAANDDAPAA